MVADSDGISVAATVFRLTVGDDQCLGGRGCHCRFHCRASSYGFRLPFRSTWSWLGLLRRPGSFYMLDYVVAGGLTQAAILIVGAVSGLDAAGVVRVAMLLLTPASVLFVGLVFALGPVCARAAGSGNIKRLKKVPFALAGTVFGVIVVYLSVALVVPSSWWSIIGGGDSTDAALNILPLAALALALNSASVGPGVIVACDWASVEIINRQVGGGALYVDRCCVWFLHWGVQADRR